MKYTGVQRVAVIVTNWGGTSPMRPLLAESSFEVMSMPLPAPTTQPLIRLSEPTDCTLAGDSSATVINIHIVDRHNVIDFYVDRVLRELSEGRRVNGAH
jgi:hypothetical protein